MKKTLLIILLTLFITEINAQCSVATPTVVENFNANSALPACWTAINGTLVQFSQLFLTRTNNVQPMAILPKVVNARGIISFLAFKPGNFGAPLITVGAVSSTNTPTTFTPIVSQLLSGISATFTLDLSAYTGNYEYLAFIVSNQTEVYLDDINYQSGCQSTTVTAIVKNYTVQLSSFGLASITTSNINNGSTTSCGPPSLDINKTSFDCSNIGINTVTLTATDHSGNISTATASVTILPAINNETVSVSQNSICTGNSATITIGSSVSGIKYYLRDDATNNVIAGPSIGTGGVLSFITSSLTAGVTFNVFAETQGGGNYGLDFDGTNDMIATTLTTSATNSLTIEAWIFPRSINNDKIVSNYFASTASGEFLLDTYNANINNGRALRFIVEGAGNVLHQIGTVNVLTLNAWNHVAGTFNNGVTQLFVNGLAVATSTAPFTSIPSCTNAIVIGEDPVIGSAEYFNGKMDEIRIWNTTRTSSEILGNMNNCLKGNEIGLKNYFKFNENAGNKVTDIVTNTTFTMSGMDPNTDWIVGNVDCGAATCNLEMTDLVTVTIAPNPTITVNSGTICAGNSFTITPAGADTYTFQGGSAIKTPTANASYTVVGTSSLGCLSNTFATSSVSVNTLPTINATTSNTLLCVGQTASLTANGATSYTWNTTSTNTVIAISPSVTTNYSVTGTDANGCVNNATITQNVSICTRINQLTSSTDDISIFPNPVLNVLTIHLDAKIEKIIIYNLLGTIVQSEINSSFSVANLNAGVYLIEVISNHHSVIRRFVKE